MSKYESLWNYLKSNNQDNYKLSYEEIKNILGFDLDHSFLTYKKELKKYGYEITKISIKEKFIIFNKINKWKLSKNKRYASITIKGVKKWVKTNI